MANDLFQQYSKEVMKYFAHPKNIGVIKNADGVGTVGNPRCGDIMRVYIKVGKRKKGKTTEEYIKDIKVQTLGCGAAVATSSMATVIVKGKSLKKAMELTNIAVAKALGGLPKPKMHCSLLAKQGIQKAIEDYQKRKKDAK